MPSRLALGNNTNASARFDALFRVIARLSCMIRARRQAGFPGGWGVTRRFRRESDCGGGGGGASAVVVGVSPAQRRRLRSVAPLEPRPDSGCPGGGGDDDDDGASAVGGAFSE